MRALLYVEPGVVSVENVPDARVEDPEDAVVAVRVSAVCGTDLHAYRGRVATIPRGTVLGHEFVGRVVEVGEQVTAFRPGDEVLGSDFTACGRCWWCRRGQHWQCRERQVFGYGSTFGAPLPGAQAELVRVPFADTVLARRPESVSAEAGIFIGDTLATGYGAAERGGVAPGDFVVVVGAGAVGQMVSLACQAFGAAAVIVVDTVADRLDLAARLGALTAEPDEARRLLDGITEGRGADVVVEAVGGVSPLDSAVALVRPAGAVVSVGAHFDTSWDAPIDAMFRDQVAVMFHIGDPMTTRDRLLPLVASGLLDPTEVVSEEVGLEDAPAAYRRFAARESIKTLLRVSE